MGEMEPGINYWLVICTFISEQNTATLFCLLKMHKHQDDRKAREQALTLFNLLFQRVKFLFQIIYFAYKWKHASLQMNLEKSVRLKHEVYDV